jgi:hypothetical protein
MFRFNGLSYNTPNVFLFPFAMTEKTESRKGAISAVSARDICWRARLTSSGL